MNSLLIKYAKTSLSIKMEESAALEYLIAVVLEVRNLFSTKSLASPGEIKIPQLRDHCIQSS